MVEALSGGLGQDKGMDENKYQKNLIQSLIDEILELKAENQKHIDEILELKAENQRLIYET